MLGMGSGLTKFEAADPAYWVAHGYAVCNPDMRGIAHSEGNITEIGSQEAQDGYDLIEWIASQPWSSGKTALTGTSYLAWSQWFIAAEQPPHLTAINPTEGLSDGYRDLAYIGGIPDKNFINRLGANHVSATGALREDLTKEIDAYPLADAAVWQDKIADTSKIKVPAYVIGSYSNTLHTMGTFRAWRNLGSSEKWLRIHDRQEWPFYYDKDNTEELRRFMDYYLCDNAASCDDGALANGEFLTGTIPRTDNQVTMGIMANRDAVNRKLVFRDGRGVVGVFNPSSLCKGFKSVRFSHDRSPRLYLNQ
nr:CocE/NonD family hydrolase [uncultured Secundilactobacillus sp.]